MRIFAFLCLIFTIHTIVLALKFTIEPKDVIIPEGNSVLLPCDGEASINTKKGPKVPVVIKWRGPDGQDIGIVGDTFR